jgi:ubiquinone/menaquinone biosynthesis C-methylase UbiE
LIYDAVERKAIDRLLPNARHGDKLLEVGCGTGHWSAYFSQKGFKVTGIDISVAMLEVARQKSIAHTRFDQADAERLPFADDEFEVAAAMTALEFTAHPTRVLSEMVRCVKKPSGTLILGALNALCPGNRARKQRHGSLYASANFLSPSEVEALLRRFGKVDLQVVGYLPKHDWLLPLASAMEHIHRFVGRRRGAFIAARLQV